METLLYLKKGLCVSWVRGINRQYFFKGDAS